MSSNDPIESMANGAVQGGLTWTLDRIKELAKKFKEKELSFIEDEETIDVVKKQRETPRFAFYRKYVTDQDLRKQIWMGLALKDLNDQNKIQNLRDKLFKKYGKNGVQVAELVQTGVISKYLNLLLEEARNQYDLVNDVESLLKELDKYTKFIKAEDDVKKQATILAQRINANLPRAMLILSRGVVASRKADELIKLLKEQIENYRFETQNDDEIKQKIHFVLHVDFKPANVKIQDF